MSRPQDVGDNKNYYADSTVGFDSEGYVLEPGADNGSDGDRYVQKAAAGSTNAFMGVNHKSTYNYDETEVRTGRPVGVIQEGEAMVLCKGGATYNVGDTVYFPASGETAGVAQKANNTPTEVGKVSERTDHSSLGSSEAGLVPVNVTGRV